MFGIRHRPRYEFFAAALFKLYGSVRIVGAVYKAVVPRIEHIALRKRTLKRVPHDPLKPSAKAFRFKFFAARGVLYFTVRRYFGTQKRRLVEQVKAV